MRRRILAAAALALAALALAAPALALRVHVRVEGVNTTIFGPSEPLVAPYQGPVVADDGSVHPLARPTPLGALEAASRRGEFAYRLRSLSFGLFVDRIGRYPGTGSSGWVYKVNGVSPPVGAGDYELKEGDRVLWYFARFGPTGGPDTLDLERRPQGCFRALRVDDRGRAARIGGILFRLDGRRFASRSGELCPVGHWHTLRAVKSGYVRSRVLRPA